MPVWRRPMRRTRRRVAPVEKRMNHQWNVRRDGLIDEREKVRDGAMNLAVGEKAKQVQRAAGTPKMGEGLEQDGVACELPAGDLIVDDDDALRHDAAAAEIRVPDLAVAHDAFRQADRFAARFEERVRKAFEQRIVVRQQRCRDGVSVRLGAIAPTVEHREYERAILHRAIAPAMSRANEWASSEAPPTSPPSISGISIYSAAFSGFMLPP